MRQELQIIAAFALELLLGCPSWLPHPVRLIGRGANLVEGAIRGLGGNGYLGGILGWALIVGSAGIATWGVVFGASLLHPLAEDVVSILILYTAFAARDLLDHGRRVHAALAAGDLAEARRCVAMIVGRDTDRLDEAGVVRATVESVAESLVDGVTSPLFFAVLGGPVAAMVFKAVSTLDSMFGHKDERYRKFGWCAARADDVANYMPARLTSPLLVLAAALLRCRPIGALRILIRDGRKHSSPNAGLPEAAMAGALNVQLGGVNYYGGEPIERPLIGDSNEPLAHQHIQRANWLMLLTAAMSLMFYTGIRLAVLRALQNPAYW